MQDEYGYWMARQVPESVGWVTLSGGSGGLGDGVGGGADLYSDQSSVERTENVHYALHVYILATAMGTK